ncbi:MAG TPA: SulP family inorganic anion transporter, partial [Pseudomonadales bacterium]|nr:SulP family inorganic anion transporter [Pseudomonadales bacterium]
MPIVKVLRDLVPPFEWGRSYDLESFRSDVIAGVIVLFLTIPQSIAYAFLAGMPPQTGLYAAFMSLILYGIFGGSRTLAVGPAAIIAIMTLEAATPDAAPYTAAYMVVAAKLALITGGIMIVLRIVNFGAVISFLSHAVITGFIAGASLLIVANQLPSVL